MALHAEVNAFTCPGKWLYIKNKIQVNILFWLSMIFNCWPSYTFILVPPENPFPISPGEICNRLAVRSQHRDSPPSPMNPPSLFSKYSPSIYYNNVSPLALPFPFFLKYALKPTSPSVLYIWIYIFMKKNFLIYLPCIGKSRTFAPAFQERESRLKLTCCSRVLIALTNNKNNLLFLWSLILKFVIFAVRFAIKGVYSGAFPFR